MKKEHWYIIIAAILYGTIVAGGQFFKDLGMSVYELSIIRPVIVVLLILPFIIFNKKLRLKKQMIPFFTLYGLIGSFGILFQYAGLAYGVPVAVIIFLYYTQPIWTLFLGKLFLKESITKIKIISTIVALLGVLVLVKPWDITSVGKPIGLIFALLGAITGSLWIIMARKSGKQKQHYVTATFSYFLPLIVFIFLFQPISRLLFQDPSITRISFNFQPIFWIYALIWSIIGGIIPYFLYYKSTEKIEAGIAQIILLIEAISATLLAFIFFNQPIGINILVGGGLILVANYLVVR